MKIIVFAYDLVLAGVTINAVELAAALRDLRGHDVILFAGPGPLESLVQEKQLAYVSAPTASQRVHPSFVRMRALRDLVRRERPDVIHAWDWPQALDTFWAEHMFYRTPLLVTDMCMALQGVLPQSVPTTFGVPAIRDKATARGHMFAKLLLPPVDTDRNRPDAVDADAFRRQHDLGDNEIVLVLVSRLDEDMKGESITRTLEVVSQLGSDLPLTLVIVGDGDARPKIEKAASGINHSLGRRAVLLTGLLVDPRPAYAAADVVVGMGSSALRGMAFEKPVIVVGKNGFAEVFSFETRPFFYRYGFYGDGQLTANPPNFVNCVRLLADDCARRRSLGRLGREFVTRHYSLRHVSGVLSAFLEAAMALHVSSYRRYLDAGRMAAVWCKERRFFPLGWSLPKAVSGRGRVPAPSIVRRPVFPFADRR